MNRRHGRSLISPISTPTPTLARPTKIPPTKPRPRSYRDILDDHHRKKSDSLVDRSRERERDDRVIDQIDQDRPGSSLINPYPVVQAVCDSPIHPDLPHPSTLISSVYDLPLISPQPTPETNPHRQDEEESPDVETRNSPVAGKTGANPLSPILFGLLIDGRV